MRKHYIPAILGLLLIAVCIHWQMNLCHGTDTPHKLGSEVEKVCVNIQDRVTDVTSDAISYITKNLVELFTERAN